MQKQRLAVWLSLILVAAIVLAGCAPRAGGGQTASTAGADQLSVDLPALVIDFDSEGHPSIGNVPLAQLGSMVPGGMLDNLALPASTIQFLTDSNIQHIQVANQPNGLLVLVNGEPIPFVKWDGDKLVATADLLSQLGVGTTVLDKVLPLIAHIGIGVIARFPVATGNAAIATYIEGGGPAAAAAKKAQADFLANVGTPPTVNLPVMYSVDGSWRVGDLTDTEWTNLTGLPWSSLRLKPEAINALMAAHISDLIISTDTSGIHIAINGKQLPYIGWADGELNHALDLAGQMGVWKTLSDQGMNMGQIVSTVQQLLPVVQASQTTINVHFPT